MLGCEPGSVIFMMGSNCEEERGSMHWWVTDQACCMSQQLKTPEHFFFFSFSHVLAHWSYSWEDASLILSPAVQWSLCLHRDSHRFSLKSWYNSSLCAMDWATLWVSFTYVYILRHCFRCALKCTFKPKKETESAEWICSMTCVMVLKLEFFWNFFPLCAVPSILSPRQTGVCNRF